MAVDKFGDPKSSAPIGMSYKEAMTMINQEGFLYEYLPESYKTAEMSQLRDNWWRDSIVEKILHYRKNPEQLAEIVKKAADRGLVKDPEALIARIESGEF